MLGGGWRPRKPLNIMQCSMQKSEKILSSSHFRIILRFRGLDPRSNDFSTFHFFFRWPALLIAFALWMFSSTPHRKAVSSGKYWPNQQTNEATSLGILLYDGCSEAKARREWWRLEAAAAGSGIPANLATCYACMHWVQVLFRSNEIKIYKLPQPAVPYLNRE